MRGGGGRNEVMGNIMDMIRGMVNGVEGFYKGGRRGWDFMNMKDEERWVVVVGDMI